MVLWTDCLVFGHVYVFVLDVAPAALTVNLQLVVIILQNMGIQHTKR